MLPVRWIAPIFALVVGTGCADPESAPSCTKGFPRVGPRIEIEAPAAFDTPMFGDWPAVATSGEVHLAVWRGAPGLYAARLTDEGAPIDVPARVIQADAAFTPAVAWDGARFAIGWAALTQGVRLMHISSDGELANEPLVEIPEADVQSLALASNGTMVLAVWTTYPASGLRGARVGSNGALLDATPLTIASASTSTSESSPPPDVTWDGSNFVAVWADPSAPTARAARISAAGVVLEPGGVDTTIGARARVIGTGAGSVAAWTDGAALRASRLSADLTPIGSAPVVVDTSNPEATSITSVSLSRSADSTIVIGYVVEGDTSEDVTLAARAYDASLAPLGARVSEVVPEANTQAIVGLSGKSHLAVSDGEMLRARRLDLGSTGLLEGPGNPIFLGAAEQRNPAVAGDEAGYLVVWEEEGKSEARLRARFTGRDGTPIGAGFDIGASPFGRSSVASAGEKFLVAWPQTGATFRLSTVTARSGVVDDRVLGDKVPSSSGIACTKAMCLVAWSEIAAPEAVLRGVRIDAGGTPLDHTPQTLAKIPIADTYELSVLPLGASIGVFWPRGAVSVDTAGQVKALPAFTPKETNVVGLPLASSGDRLLVARTRSVPTVPIERWIEILRADGTRVGRLDRIGEKAAWDGVDFLVTTSRDRTFLVSADAGLVGPQLATSAALDPALASASPGYTLRVGVDRAAAHGGQRVIVQALERQCP